MRALSLRPEIYGFDLARLRALLGSGNESAVERAAAELEQREHAEEAKDIAARAILGSRAPVPVAVASGSSAPRLS